MIVRVTNKAGLPLPKYETPQSAGMDVLASLSVKPKFLYNSFYTDSENEWDRVVNIRPGGRALIPTDLFMEIPEGYEIQVRPRSGLALKHGITVLNTPGTIDADYRGNVGVVLINNGTENFAVKQGDRIAQIVLNKVETIEWIVNEVLSETERGEGGFGSTDINTEGATTGRMQSSETAETNEVPNPKAEAKFTECNCKKNKNKGKK